MEVVKEIRKKNSPLRPNLLRHPRNPLRKSLSTIVLIMSFSCTITTPCTGTVIFWLRSPLATALHTQVTSWTWSLSSWSSPRRWWSSSVSEEKIGGVVTVSEMAMMGIARLQIRHRVVSLVVLRCLSIMVRCFCASFLGGNELGKVSLWSHKRTLLVRSLDIPISSSAVANLVRMCVIALRMAGCWVSMG